MGPCLPPLLKLRRSQLYYAGEALAATGRRDDDGNQVLVARQVPLQRSPEMIPLQRPVPELPARRPLPFATDNPSEIRTETAPPGVMPPVTLPPPADETCRPETLKGALLVALQFPARVVNTTLQFPS